MMGNTCNSQDNLLARKNKDSTVSHKDQGRACVSQTDPMA